VKALGVAVRPTNAIPSIGYPVPYALSTVVFLVYGYLAMVFS
jgi:hypothetical protein